MRQSHNSSSTVPRLNLNVNMKTNQDTITSDNKYQIDAWLRRILTSGKVI
jgi:hypothetical protein